MKIECDELLVICDNCGHAIHVKELDNNLIKLNNKNDKLISEQAAIDALIEWYGCEPNSMDYFKKILAKKSSAQSVDKNINVPINDTISRQAAIDDIKAMYEWHDVVTEDRLIEHMKRLPSAQPERKKGKWIIRDNPGTGWYRVTCSECGEDVTSTIPMIGFFPNAKPLWDYCPYCGAKMEVEDDA